MKLPESSMDVGWIPFIQASYNSLFLISVRSLLRMSLDYIELNGYIIGFDRLFPGYQNSFRIGSFPFKDNKSKIVPRYKNINVYLLSGYILCANNVSS